MTLSEVHQLIYDAIENQDQNALDSVPDKYINFNGAYSADHEFNYTPLQHAISNRWYDGIRYLLLSGSNAAIYGKGKNTPYCLACDAQDEDQGYKFTRLLMLHQAPISRATWNMIVEVCENIGQERMLKLMANNKSLIQGM